MSDKKEEKKDGKWVTINGNHIFIKDGQTVEEALNDFKARNGNIKSVIKNNKDNIKKIEEENRDISVAKEFFKTQNAIYEEEYLKALDILLKKDKINDVKKEAEEALRSIGHVPNLADSEQVAQWYNMIQNVKNIKKETNERFGHYNHEEKIMAVAIDSNSSFEMAEEVVNAMNKYTAPETFDQFKNGYMNYEEKVLNEYIKNAPKYKGEIYRGLSFTNSNINEFLNDYQEGNEIELEHVTSFTASRYQAGQFANQQEVPVILMVDKNKNGASVRHLSNLRDEEEVLHPIGSKFKITKVIHSGKMYYIHMEEINNE